MSKIFEGTKEKEEQCPSEVSEKIKDALVKRKKSKKSLNIEE